MRFAIALLVMSLMVSATPTLFGEPLKVPDELLLAGEIGELEPGVWEIGVPVLVFTQLGWETFSEVQTQRMEEAVQVAVAPLLAKVEVLKRRATIWPGWKPVAIGGLVTAGVLALTVVLK